MFTGIIMNVLEFQRRSILFNEIMLTMATVQAYQILKLALQ